MELGEYRMMRDKAKNLVVDVCPKLAYTIYNYALSGNGEGQIKGEDDDNYDQFDVEHCINGENYANHLENGTKDGYLLYL